MSKTLTSVSMPFAKIEPVKPVNDEFTLTKVYICSPGKNRNMSYISKEELDAAKDAQQNDAGRAGCSGESDSGGKFGVSG